MVRKDVQFVSIRQIVALVTSKNMEMHQMDVTTTFLCVPLEEEVYMQHSKGTMRPEDEGKVITYFHVLGRWIARVLYHF